MIGQKIRENLELTTVEYEIKNLSHLLVGAEALIVLFVPYCFGSGTGGTMESLVTEVNSSLDEFLKQDLRVACICRWYLFLSLVIVFINQPTREPPNTVKHWISERNIRVDVYCDPSLTVSNYFVGTFDLSKYLAATKGVQLGSYYVAMPGAVVISGDGKITSRYVASSPGNV